MADFGSTRFSMRLNAGFRADAFATANAVLERELNIQLTLNLDTELGDRHYSYAPHPLPQRGVAGVNVHINDAADPRAGYMHRPDLTLVILIDLFGDNLLDLGRLDHVLRRQYEVLFDVAEYSVVTLPSSHHPTRSPDVHFVQFAAGGVPLTDAPTLASTLELELPLSEEGAVRACLAAVDATHVAMTTAIHSTPVEDAMSRLTFEFDSPSLLALGACVQEIEDHIAGTVIVRRYGVRGDLLRNGESIEIERRFASAADAAPSWRVPAPRA